MAIAYLSLGSNIDAERNLRSSIKALRSQFGDVLVSPIYQSAAVGFEGDDFLNAAARLETSLDPIALDAWLHDLEDQHGRRRDVPRFSSRPLDIDVLLYDALIFKGPGNLELPRSELAEQAFVLRPMVDIASQCVHPIIGRTLREIWESMSIGDRESVRMSRISFDHEGWGASNPDPKPKEP
ncbi:MAG: 2-amino-4-hydroxy-6-hydroxymethyldihydropteridine diphosphokinase [Xanthomonadaceae bacterium]|nr:2-amino-4-hydroxy-6-hydroxymethyldihydropteridine diphosphokinase [Xanthomonadaceae bacterium]MDP2184304.1 2-amino-4-hydroxy-6-hydroxymethyldihydropteridine diphosphokinase [Xanthomonadales bacterium]MDZ4115612.1 2-amino-4-hydroxy-6-hydroxymethyldihydropteridine diphosphokinase [Xanthomonadaceae bacterium]MDZ4377737.1 2-amino-4-hydroxy-6-hydroxymethyldihydropteridine diphosphokinase [Xanthomonadaceae bacterium]